MEQQFYLDEPCVVSCLISEFGWGLQYWQGRLRYLKYKKYPDHKFLLMCDPSFHTFVEDFISYTIALPEWFYNLNLERDGYEAPLRNSLSGALTPPDVYSNLIKYIRKYYNTDKAIEIWTPRGCNPIVNKMPQIFFKYTTNKKIKYNKPIIVVMPRKRERAANRNIPEFIWRELVEKLRQTFLVVLAGTTNGSCLQNYEANDVINLIKYNGDDKTKLIIEYLNNSICSVSSQSGSSHLSLLTDTPSYLIGDQKNRHVVELNRFNTPTSFRFVFDYRAIDADAIVSDLRIFIDALMKEGWVNEEIYRPSLRILKNKKDLIGVEIGVDRGLNALNILKNLDIKKLYLIDPYSIYKNLINIGCNMSEEQCIELEKEAHERLKEYEDKIVWIRDLSENVVDVVPDNLDFAYIDGNHRYEYVKKDLELYYKKVRDGGVVACHDYDYPDVKRAADEFFNNLNIKMSAMRCSDNFNRLDAWIIKPEKYSKIISEDIIKLRELIK